MIDLFEHYDTLPFEVQVILDEFSEMDSTYESCAKLVEELNKVGYTCEYYLDAEPFGLRELSKFDEWEDDKLHKVFNYILDEMSSIEADEVKREVRTRGEIIQYFIIQEERFESFFGE